MNNFNYKNKTRLISIVFWGGYLLLGILIYKDYGVTWDEPIDRLDGLVNLKYIFKHLLSNEQAQGVLPNIATIPELQNFFDRDYGILFQLPCALFEVLFCKDNLVKAYQARHLFIFLSTYICLLAFWFGIKKLFYSPLLAYTAVLFYILSPRFFAGSFNNAKDIVLVAFVLLNLYTLCNFLSHNSVQNLILHALSTAFVIDVRINGVVYFVTFLGILVVQGIITGNIKQKIKETCLYCLSSFCFTVVFFPYLWSHTFRHLKEVFQNMSNFRWDGLNLINGEFVRSTQLTASYIPEWIVVTLPLFVLLLFVIGLCGFGILSFSKIKENIRQLNNSIFYLLLFSFVILFGSVIAIIVLNSTLYNDWRQVYFLYPEIMVFAVFGIRCLMQAKTVALKWCSKCIYLFCIINATYTGLFIINNHPSQNIYFNIFAKYPLKDNYDLDYWGGSTHLALEHLLKLESGHVYYCNESAIPDTGRFLFTQDEQNRLKKVSCDLAKYRVNNFTAFSEDNIRLRNLEGKRIKSFYVDNNQLFLEILEGYRSFEDTLASLTINLVSISTLQFSDLKANVDSISVNNIKLVDGEHKIIDIEGWFFDKSIPITDHSTRVVILSNGTETITTKVSNVFRPDVGNNFNDRDLYNCGFNTLIDMKALVGKWDLYYGVIDEGKLFTSGKMTTVNL